jgi:dihydropteroate synthase
MFEWSRYGDRTVIMGILNVTPDSFSDGGQYADVPAAVARAREMVEQGADIIDVGGESTRPGAENVSLQEELRRVLPVIEALAAEVDVPLSIDTYKAEVARQALLRGAHIVNDVWGLQADDEMAAVVATFGCPVVLTHNRLDPHYADWPTDVLTDLQTSIAAAHAAGIRDAQIWLDPGIGFAKTYEQNLQLLGDLRPLVGLGYPVLLGTSRKRVVRETIRAAAEDCLEATAATVAFGIAQGCRVVRVHDIKEMKRVAVMSDAMVRAARG